jgi:prepilin-type N-terminal cleavage/methylation domain-containing protein
VVCISTNKPFCACRLNNQQGFTLLELLVVISLMAIVASLMVVSYDSVKSESNADLTRYEMSEIRKALLQFRRDTGELPCRVFRDGFYQPDPAEMGLVFPDTSGWDQQDYADWCAGFGASGAEPALGSALSMLAIFPYTDLDANAALLWNIDTKRGWNGSYLNQQGLNDAWGNRYLLIDPELDYRQTARCLEDAGNYDIDLVTGYYSCLSPSDSDWDSGTYTLAANIARLVSSGEDGIYAGENSTDPCLAVDGSDDLVLCLLR